LKNLTTSNVCVVLCPGFHECAECKRIWRLSRNSLRKEFRQASATKHAAIALHQLSTYCKAGRLPPEYEGPRDWLFDFYPGLRWKPEEMEEDCKAIVSSHLFPTINRFFLRRYSFDLRAGVDAQTQQLGPGGSRMSRRLTHLTAAFPDIFPCAPENLPCVGE
jgi:hypothetical protein